MPKQPIDYSKCIIYKIVSNNPEVREIYVGSTTDFKSRKNQHKKHSQYENDNIKLYKTIRDNGGWDNYSMIPIIEYPCENRIQLLIKEEEYRKEFNAELNMFKCYVGLPKKEYIKEYTKENVEKILEKQKEYREKNADKLNEKSKSYYNENKEKINEKMKHNYNKNKEKINEKIICECGITHLKRIKSSHIKSKFHQDFIKNNNII